MAWRRQRLELNTLTAGLITANIQTADRAGNEEQAQEALEAPCTAAQGYRVMITAESAEVLMLEQSQFAMAMYKQGIRRHSEAAYRQLRKAATGRAKDSIDLALSDGVGSTTITQLERLKILARELFRLVHNRTVSWISWVAVSLIS